MFARQEHFRLSDPEDGWATIETAELPALRVGRVVSTGHSVALSDSDRMTVLLPMRGRLGSETRRSSHEAHARQSLIFSPNWRSTVVQPSKGDPFEAVVLLFTPMALIGAAEHFDPSVARGLRSTELAHVLGSGAVASRVARMSSIATGLIDEMDRPDGLLRRARARSTASAFLFELLLEILAESGVLDTRGRSVDPVAARRVRRAEEFMRDRFGDIVSIEEVARAADVSVRMLQLSFSKFGDSPRARLNRIRLDEARARLLAPRGMDTVSTIAMECGFTHLGRFSQGYRAHFDEAPAVTLKRARGDR